MDKRRVGNSQNNYTMSPDEQKEPGIPKKISDVEEIIIRCECYVEKDGEDRLAEILSINSRRSPPRFYVHYVDFNKRLDEWITANRINLEKDVIFPSPKTVDEDANKQKKRRRKPQSNPRRLTARIASKIHQNLQMLWTWIT